MNNAWCYDIAECRNTMLCHSSPVPGNRFPVVPPHYLTTVPSLIVIVCTCSFAPSSVNTAFHPSNT